MSAADTLTSDDVATEPQSEPEITSGQKTGVLRSNVGLAVAPMAIAGLAVVLYLWVSGAEKDSIETDALDWATKLRPQLTDHIDLTVRSTLLVLLIAIPLGVILTRPSMRFLATPIMSVASSGQAIPAYGLLVIFAAWLGTDQSTAVFALTVFAILPVLRNTMVGLDQVDQSTIEAGRGMGMSKMLVLRKIELPLAVPVILAGVRTALIINVGMASLAFLIGAGGLGETINTGLKLQRDMVTLTGASMVALLALTVDWLAAVAERTLRPKGL